jgi:hypothetical protein
LPIHDQCAFDLDSRGGELGQEFAPAMSGCGLFNDLSRVTLRKSRNWRQPEGGCK